MTRDPTNNALRAHAAGPEGDGLREKIAYEVRQAMLAPIPDTFGERVEARVVVSGEVADAILGLTGSELTRLTTLCAELQAENERLREQVTLSHGVNVLTFEEMRAARFAAESRLRQLEAAPVSEELRRLYEAAAPGPWRIRRENLEHPGRVEIDAGDREARPSTSWSAFATFVVTVDGEPSAEGEANVALAIGLHDDLRTRLAQTGGRDGQ